MLKNQNQKLNAITWLIIPNVLLCFSLGFIGIMLLRQAYTEIKAIETEDIYFLSFKLSILFFFLIGFGVKKFVKHHHKFIIYTELTTILLLCLLILTLKYFSSSSIQVDYIFYTNFFYFFVAIISFAFGIFTAVLRNFRLWGFLLGILSFLSFHTFNENIISLKPEEYINNFLILLAIEIALISFLSRFKSISFLKHEQNKHPLTTIFFFSGIALFVLHSISFYVNTESELLNSLMGFSIGLLICNIIYSYGYLKGKIRLKYYLGLTLLFTNVVLSLKQATQETYLPFLFFMDTALIAIYSPYRINYYKLGLSIMNGFALFISAFYSNQYYEIRYILLFIFVALILLPILLQKLIKPYYRILALSSTLALVFYSFTPLPIIHDIDFTEKEEISPVPFLFTGIQFNEKDFVYYNTSLPFPKVKKLPKKNAIQNKTIVLGLKKKEKQVLTYVKQLDKFGFPFLIFQEKKDPVIKTNLNLRYLEYPLFRIYYSEKGYQALKPTNLDALRLKNKEIDYIESRINIISEPAKISEALTNIYTYSSSSFREKAKEYQNIFYNSYKIYLEYYYEHEYYNQATELAGLCLLFFDKDPSFYKLAYDSLIHISPEESHMNLMNRLINKPEYKLSILKRLYPLYLSQQKYKEAISIIDTLLLILEQDKKNEELDNLKIEKAKIFLQNSDLLEAGLLIKRELSRNPDSLLWNKLLENLNFRIEENRIRFRNYNG